MPRVSVILPTYNRLNFLRDALASVLAQTVQDWELVIVDDGSTDDTIPWIRALNDPRVHIVERAHTASKPALRNAGIRQSSAPRIAFLDSDDRWAPSKLERQLDFHDRHPEIRWSYTGFRFIDTDGAEIDSARFRKWAPHSGWILREVLTHEASITLPSVMVERALFDEVGGFNESFDAAEDYELWVRLADSFECGVLTDALLDVRKHRAVLTQRPEVSRAFARIYRNFRHRSSRGPLRTIARQHEVISAVEAAILFARAVDWPAASQSAVQAIRAAPLSSAGYRAMARVCWRRLRTVTHRGSTAREA